VTFEGLFGSTISSNSPKPSVALNLSRFYFLAGSLTGCLILVFVSTSSTNSSLFGLKNRASIDYCSPTECFCF
jgi:hypothetical protein